jgi:hypothetical protein
VVKVRVEKGPGSRENKPQAKEKKEEEEDEATLRLLI